MTDLTTYSLDDGVATITLDDGKVNALSAEMLGAIGDQLDRAEQDEAVVVLTGRATTFSAGFDLRSQDWPTMLAAGAGLAERLLAFPQPTVAVCNGNAIAMGAFLLLSTDVRIGVTGAAKIGLNEVQIGMTLPWFGIELAKHRLTKPAYDTCTVTGPLLGPDAARDAGFLDILVAPEALAAATAEVTAGLKTLDRAAHAATKLRTRTDVIAGVRASKERIQAGRPIVEW